MNRHDLKRHAWAIAITGCAIAGVSAGIALAVPGQQARAAALTAGTPRHPQGIKLTASFSWLGLSPSTQPILTQIDMCFPRGSVYNGARYPTCSLQALNTAGPAGCPKRAIMGRGSGVAYADTTITRPTITVVNGGASTVYFYTILNNPARVQEPVIGHITRTPGNYTYHLSVAIPQNLQVVAGVPIELTNLTITAGRGTWLATTAAPAGIKVTGTFNTGSRISFLIWAQDT